MTRGRVAGLLLVTLIATGCGGLAPAAARGRVAPPPIHRVAWKDCSGGFQCAKLPVPLDYSNARSSTISLALIRRPASRPGQRIGSLLLNPGGPGASGVDFLRQDANYFGALNYRFDLVSWDPRGVGASGPIRCLDNSQTDRYLATDPVLDDPQETQDFVQLLQEFARSCQERNGRELPYVDTASTARDLDRIRQALGDRQITYLGFSYGTYLGQWYAHLFPTRIRAMALDGVVDPALSRGSHLLLEAAGFQQSLDGFFAYCRSDPSCVYTRKGDADSRLLATMNTLDQGPMRIDNRVLTRTMAMSVLLAALYSPNEWTYLDEALATLDNGDGRLMLQFFDSIAGRNSDGSYSNISIGATSAVECLDSAPPGGMATYDARAPSLASASRLFGPYLQYSDLGCFFWPVRGKHVDERLTIAGSPAILLVGATGDPVTTFTEARSVASEISGSVLLTRQGYGHTSYFFSACVSSAVNGYFIEPAAPPRGRVCEV